jgi:A/G-specific adenine glycosylase
VYVSEIMLQQTQVKTVIPYWERWMRALPTLQTLADADQQTIHKLWEGLGYYTRVRNLQKAAREIISRHHGEFPRTYEDLLALPGIGPYTAGAICSIAFNQPQPILDGNVIRVLTRVYAIAGNPRENATNQKLWNIARELVKAAENFEFRITNVELSPSTTPLSALSRRSPAKAELRQVAPTRPAGASERTGKPPSEGGSPHSRAYSSLNQSLMELGALLCTPNQPQCPRCPLRADCRACRTRRVEHFPNLGARPAATTRHFAAFVIQRRNRWLVRQRPAGRVNAHLWEFPNLEIEACESDLMKLARNSFGIALAQLVQLGTIKHTITRYRITLRIWHGKAGQVAASKSKPPGRWLTLEEIQALPFTSAHRKIINQLRLPGRLAARAIPK